MLPFLKNEKGGSIASLIVKSRQPDESETQEKDSDSTGIEACAKDMISAIEMKDHKRLAEAMRDAFTILENQPHEEAESVSPHTYDAQKED